MMALSALVDVASPFAGHLTSLLVLPLASHLALGVATLVLASARIEVAKYISTLIDVYVLLILVHIVLQWLFAFGLHPPYSRASSAVLGFVRDVCEPFLRLFRRLLPSFGGLDLSPIVAILVLVIVNRVVVEGLIHG
jgi:YggT family protein